MQIQYRNVDVALDERTLHIHARLDNLSDQDWTNGEVLSWQIYDAETDALLEDGPRQALFVPAEQAAEAAVCIQLPADDGAYRVFVSPLNEGSGWFYERGEPFVLIEAQVAKGETNVTRCGVSTTDNLDKRRAGRALWRALTYPFASISKNSSLIRSMVRRDIAGRYAGSFAGTFWTIIHPLMMMLTYWFVFGVVLRTRFGEDGRSSNFVLYFLAGMLPWLAFSEAAGRAPTVVWEHANFVKKVVFPLEILPVNLTAAGLFSEVFGVAIFILGMIGFGHWPTASALWLPALLVPQVLFTLGVSWILAAMGVFFRDLGQFIGFLLTVWFFTTPICYPEAALPENYRWVFEINPMYVLVRGYRSVLLEGTAPETVPLIALTAVSLALFFLGYGWFYKLKKQFADLV
ncbi:MAG: ABC transporter permease [Bryobacterales bacterium]|nr:ABC transporter permease [Bryobacterales bacterium]